MMYLGDWGGMMARRAAEVVLKGEDRHWRAEQAVVAVEVDVEVRRAACTPLIDARGR